MPKLIVATHNRHKTEEIAAIIGEHFDAVTDLATLAEQHGDDAAPEPEETEETFEGNSRLKAESAAQARAIVELGKSEAVWILVRGVSTIGPMTFESLGDSQVGLRDDEIAAGAACP